MKSDDLMGICVLIIISVTIIIVVKLIKSKKNNNLSEIEVIKELHAGLEDIKGILGSSHEVFLDIVKNSLNDVKGNIKERLDESLDQKIDKNFKKVEYILGSLYKTLGELRTLEGGVVSLNKILSNVKQRGVYGEIQLENILKNIFDNSQYDENVLLNENTNERVEFAVKIPEKDGGYTYLPIDAKFPIDLYNKIIEASDNMDKDQLTLAIKQLERRIKEESKKIMDKYINPPKTTDFAIMFIPTESMYAEILKIDGLTESMYERFKIIICGPHNVIALLNSLFVGFRQFTINKQAKDMINMLLSLKKQFEKFDEIINNTQKSINNAAKKTEELYKRNNMIKNKLSKIETLNGNDVNINVEDDDTIDN